MLNQEYTDNYHLILSPQRQTQFWALLRSSPVSLFAVLLITSMQYPTIDNYLFIIFYMGTFALNGILKYIATTTYRILDIDYIPLIGQGSRPPGAHSCTSFITGPLEPASSFGMPSGHSQLAWFFATYSCLNIINCQFNYFQNLQIGWNPALQGLCCFGLILMASLISYSRVEIEHCHTRGQVFMGALVGIISACFAYKIKIWLKKNYLGQGH